MATLAEIRQQYPQYHDMSDAALADALYRKFYSDMPRAEFDAKIGAAPAREGEDRGALDAGARGFAQGATFGLADEIAGGFGGVMDWMGFGPEGSKGTFSGGYNRTLEKARAIDRQGEADHPIASTVGNIGGAIATLPLLGEVSVVRAPATLGGKVLNAAATGAAYGAGYGAGSAEGGIENRLTGAATGAALGGATGAAIPIVARGAGKVISRLTRPTTPAPSTELVRAADRIGVTLPKAAATDSMLVQRLGSTVVNIPIGGSPLKKASEKAISELGDAAEGVAKGFGKGKIFKPDEAGATARGALERYIGPTTKAKVSKAYDAVDALINPTVTTPLNKTATVARTILGRRSAAALPGPGGAVSLIADAAGRPKGLTYEGLKLLRQRVGEMLDGGILPAEISQAELKQIYGALSDDLRAAVARSGGPKALAAFERANRYNMLVNQRRDNLMRLLGAKNDEGVFDRLVRAAGTKSTADTNLLLQARKAIPPEEWDDIASGVIARLGRTPTGQSAGATAVPGGFSADRFMTAYNNLTPGGRKILFRSTGAGGSGLADALDDIATVSKRFKELQRFANPSGTGQNVIGGTQILSGSGALLGAVDPVSFAASIIGPNLISRALARPATVRSMASYGRVYNGYAVKPNNVSRQALAAASRILAVEVGQEAGLSAAQVAQIAAGLQGGDEPAQAGQQ